MHNKASLLRGERLIGFISKFTHSKETVYDQRANIAKLVNRSAKVTSVVNKRICSPANFLIRSKRRKAISSESARLLSWSRCEDIVFQMPAGTDSGRSGL